MPEVAEVFLMGYQSSQKYTNSILNCITFHKKPGKKTKNCTYETLDQLKKLLPKKVEKIYSRGKKAIIQLESNIYIVISPLLTGGLTFTKGDYSHTEFNFIDEKKEESTLYFDDKLHWGLVNTYFDKTAFDEKMKDIGPDWINDKITLEFYSSKIKNKRIKTNQIVQFLMNQKYISGIGNYLKAEILYDAKMRPDKTLEQLSDKDIETLYNSTLKIVKLSLEGNGLTIKDYKTPDNKTGIFEACIYNKSVDPLGNPVIIGNFKDQDRSTYWCPEIQK
jgi:formamidopyrimidine-DNA glycosylase